jgi:hypothetical protein
MPFALLSQRLYVSQFMNTYVTEQLVSPPSMPHAQSKRACQEDNVMLVTDDDSAAREQGEDELSTAPSVYRSIEEFGLPQRHVATVIQQLGHASSLHTTTSGPGTSPPMRRT